jgi:pantothenate kinase-related protein Tda10
MWTFTDYTTKATHGAGVRDLIGHLLKDDLLTLEQHLHLHLLLPGYREQNQPFQLPAYRTSLFFTGPSDSGKSTLAMTLLEPLVKLSLP